MLAGTPSFAADPTPEPEVPVRADPYATYRYEGVPAPRQFFRATLEGLGVLSVGYIEYLVSTKQYAPGGRVLYDGSVFYDKVSGNAQSFDANQFGTNFIGHPLGGTLYYLSARSNRLSVAQSFAWAFTGSLFWEYLGEIDEKPSYNDMIVTPWAGFANGEVFTQLSSFFARGRPTVHGKALQYLFGTPRSVHDWADDLEPEHAASTDALGFPEDIWHDFRFGLSAGSTFQSGIRAPGSASFDTRLALGFEVRNLPQFGKPGKEARLFDDGNIASLRFDLGLSEGTAVEAHYEARVTPVGYYMHDAHVDSRGRLWGQSGIVGISFGYEYGVHDYDRDRRQPKDLFSTVRMIGLLGEYTAYIADVKVQSRLDLGADFSGVRAYGLQAYALAHSELDLPYVLRNEGYYFAGGPSVAPSLSVSTRAFELTTGLRFDDYAGITGFDVDQSALTLNVPRSDRRLTAKARLALRPVPALELSTELEAGRREGQVGEVRASRTERSWLGGIGVRF